MVDMDFLQKVYFWKDAAVPYKVNGGEISLKPVLLKDAIVFVSSAPVISQDKNTSSNVAVIQMPYLQYLCELLIGDKVHGSLYLQQFINIVNLCFDDPSFNIQTKNGQFFLINPQAHLEINAAQFEDIRRIVLYQNFAHYNDSYIDPELKAAMDATDALKNRSLEMPSLERKIAIITAHTGIVKETQLAMTYRSHSMLWEEVCGEVDFMSSRPVVLFTGNGNKIDHWLFKKKKGKFDDYITSFEDFSQKMRGSVKQFS